MSLLSPSLQAFWAVAEKGTVQDAARKIGLTQTGVTQRIRSLEKQLKTTLFTRSRKGMRLTAEGESLLLFVKQCKENEGMALSKIQRAALDSIIEVGISGPSSILRSRVIPQFIQIYKNQKNIRFRFDLSDVESNAEKLKVGASEFAILEHHEVTREMDSKILKPERYKLYVATSWKRRLLSEIVETEPIIDFNLSDKMTLDYLEKYHLKKKSRKERHFANNTDALMSMIIQGCGYSVLSEEFASTYVKRGELCDIAPSHFFDFKIALAWYYRAEMSEYFKSLVAVLK